MTPQYKERVLAYLRASPDGKATPELRAKFPRAPLRQMEKEDRTIEYRDDHWFAVAEPTNT